MYAYMYQKFKIYIEFLFQKYIYRLRLGHNINNSWGPNRLKIRIMHIIKVLVGNKCFELMF